MRKRRSLSDICHITKGFRFISSTNPQSLYMEFSYTLYTFSIIAPLFITFCQMFGGRRTPSARPFFVDVPYWPLYSTDKFISCVVPGPSQWFFHFGEEIVIALNQEKTTTLCGTEPHHSSWQFKESHRCCHWPLAPLEMGDFRNMKLLPLLFI